MQYRQILQNSNENVYLLSFLYCVAKNIIVLLLYCSESDRRLHFARFKVGLNCEVMPLRSFTNYKNESS